MTINGISTTPPDSPSNNRIEIFIISVNRYICRVIQLSGKCYITNFFVSTSNVNLYIPSLFSFVYVPTYPINSLLSFIFITLSPYIFHSSYFLTYFMLKEYPKNRSTSLYVTIFSNSFKPTFLIRRYFHILLPIDGQTDIDWR